jgi:hypothetical protein
MKLSLDKFLENKIVLYVVAFISGTSLLNLVLTKKVNAVIFFIAVGYLTSFFNKNMIVIMLVALLSTNMLIHSRLTILREGMEGGDDDGKDEDKIVEDFSKKNKKNNKKKGEKKTKEGLSKIKPAVVADEETEEDELKNDINYASTIEAAYNNLDGILSSDALKNMTTDTQKLVDQQKKLMENVKQVQPMMENVLSMVKESGIDSSKMLSMFNQMSGKQGNDSN